MKERRSNYDVTNTVCVSDPARVCDAVRRIYLDVYPHAEYRPLERAFRDFARLFRGDYPGYHGCDTRYHDVQHTLDMTLALARLIAAYDRTATPAERLGPRRALVGLISALFHDSGYIRKRHDSRHREGAEYTKIHVTRSARFLARYLPSIGLVDAVPVTDEMVHFTGYEIDLDDISLDDERYAIIGHLLGTADLMAQMADRCYLEKCRDRLFDEFRVGGITEMPTADGGVKINYDSPYDLLRKTPGFVDRMWRERMDGIFGGAWRLAGVYFNGPNHYTNELDLSLRHLDHVLENDAWHLLRRRPPVFTAEVLADAHQVDSDRPRHAS